VKKINKILIVFVLLLNILLVNNIVFAATNNKTNQTKNESTVDTQYFDKIKQEREQEELEKSGYKETDYSFFDKSTKQKIYDYVHIEKNNVVICIVIGAILLIGLIITFLVKDVSKSTKACIIIAILALATFVFQYLVEGGIKDTLDIVLKALGGLLLLISYIYIFKHDNLIMYVPVCIIGSGYVAYQFGILDKYPILIIGLLAIPIILFVLGNVAIKAKEIEIFKPVDEKHERK